MFIHRLPNVSSLSSDLVLQWGALSPEVQQLCEYQIKGATPFQTLLTSSLLVALPVEMQYEAINDLCKVDHQYGARVYSDIRGLTARYQAHFNQKWDKFSKGLSLDLMGDRMFGFTLRPWTPSNSISILDINLVSDQAANQVYQTAIKRVLKMSTTLEEAAKNLVALYKQMEGPSYFPLACAVASNLWEIIPFLIEAEGYPREETSLWITHPVNYRGLKAPDGLLDILGLAGFHCSSWNYVAVLSYLTDKQEGLSVRQEREVAEKVGRKFLPCAVYDAFLAKNRAKL